VSENAVTRKNCSYLFYSVPFVIENGIVFLKLVIGGSQEHNFLTVWQFSLLTLLPLILFLFIFQNLLLRLKNSKEGDNPEKEYIDKTMN
jgi:hypothetical protein